MKMEKIFSKTIDKIANWVYNVHVMIKNDALNTGDEEENYGCNEKSGSKGNRNSG